MLYAVMESDLRTLSPKNIVVKYADDTNVLVPAHSDIGLLQELNHVKQWAEDNKTIISLLKTKEIVFRRPNPRLHISSLSIPGVQQVSSAVLTLTLTLRYAICVWFPVSRIGRADQCISQACI